MIQVSGACDVHGLYNLLLEAPHKVDILGICPNTYMYVYIYCVRKCVRERERVI